MFRGNHKKSLLVGLNYEGTDCELGGCENDVLNIKSMLILDFGYKNGDIKVLMDKDIKIYNQKTTECKKENTIIRELKYMFKGCKAGDSFYFHYSGHGTSVPDNDGDEEDGMDEAIVLVIENKDYIIRDDDINEVLMSLPKGVSVVLVFDCCMSGTICDLQYQYDSNTKTTHLVNDKVIKANVVMLSGCKDSQTSSDVYLPLRDDYFGALTTAFTEIVRLDKDISWEFLVEMLRNLLLERGHSQIPQLSSSNGETFNKIMT